MSCAKNIVMGMNLTPAGLLVEDAVSAADKSQRLLQSNMWMAEARLYASPVVPVISVIAPEMKSTDVISCKVCESY